METGAYLVNGTEVVADTADAAALIKSKTGVDVVKEEALKSTDDDINVLNERIKEIQKQIMNLMK